MKKLLVLSLLFITALTAKAQENFIEVTVADTVWVEPDTYIYRITLNPDENVIEEVRYKDPKGYRVKAKQEQLHRKKLSDSIVLVIKKNNFTIMPPTISEQYQYFGESEYKGFSTDVLVGSVDSLKILYGLISNTTSLIAAVEGSYNKNQLEGTKQLYKKLLATAGEKAAALAALSKRKLGIVLSIKENSDDKESSSSGWTIYPPLSSLNDSVIPGWHTNTKSKYPLMPSGQQLITGFPIRNSLTVRFLLE